MIFFIIGASGSGKTACLGSLLNILPNFTIYDFDDIGVPDNPDKIWRQEATEKWINRLIQCNKSEDFCLLGQMVPGEIISCPSSPNLNSFHIILLDCSDEMRIERLKKRGTYGINQDTLNWSAWLRMHCIDCKWEQHVIKVDSSPLMNFTQWEKMSSWSPQVKIHAIDTTPLTIDQVSQEIARICQQKLDDVV